MEWLPSVQFSRQDWNFVNTSEVRRSALFHMKTRVSLKYFVNDCSLLQILILPMYFLLEFSCDIKIPQPKTYRHSRSLVYFERHKYCFRFLFICFRYYCVNPIALDPVNKKMYLTRRCINVFLSCSAQTYSEPCQTSKTVLFAKLVSKWKPLTIFAKRSILDIW